jgi:hypothetical protein
VLLRELYQVQCKIFVRCNTHLQLHSQIPALSRPASRAVAAAKPARLAAKPRYHGGEGGIAMKMRALRFGAVALACLLASACKGRQEPVKPIASTPVVCFIDY